jgi:hypothetical protein
MLRNDITEEPLLCKFINVNGIVNLKIGFFLNRLHI